MRPVRLRRSLKCLFASLLLTVSLAQSTPISVRAQSDDPALLKSMSLLINALSVELDLGDVIPVTLIATNTGLETVEGVSLHLHDISGILWGEDFKEPWLELGDLKPGESRVIATQAKIEGLPADGALLLEHWPREGQRHQIAIATFPREDLLVHWLEAHGSGVAWH